MDKEDALRHLHALLLSSFLVLTVQSEPADQLPAAKKPDPLPAAARQTMDRFNMAVTEAQMTLDDAVLKAAETARKELAKTLEAEMKAGRLDTALAVRARLEALPTGQEGRPEGGIDLLKLIDPRRDAVKGVWELREGVLSCQPGDWVRLEIPYTPPDEYDLTIVATRVSGDDGLFFGLVYGNVHWTLSFDSQPWAGYITGIGCVDSVHLGAPGNPTKTVGRVLVNGKPAVFAFKVRKSGMTAAVDGKERIAWKEYGRLSTRTEWMMPNARALMLGAWESEIRFSRVLLVPVAGSGSRLPGR